MNSVVVAYDMYTCILNFFAAAGGGGQSRPWYFEVDNEKKIYLIRDGPGGTSGKEFGAVKAVTSDKRSRGSLIVSQYHKQITFETPL